MTVVNQELFGRIKDQFHGTAQVRISLKTDTDRWDVNNSTSVGREWIIPWEYAASLSSNQPGYEFEDGTVRILQVSGVMGVDGSGLPIPFLPYLSRLSEGYFELRSSLHAEHLAQIEEYRNGQALMLNVHLSALVVANTKPGPQCRSELVSVETSSRGIRVTVPREHWISMLNRAGESRYVVEIPGLSLPKQKSAWTSVMQLFEKTLQCHREGRYEDAVSGCRKIMEGIIEILASSWGLSVKLDSGAIKPDRDWQKELHGRLEGVLTKPGSADMLATLIASMRTWSNSAHHFGSEIPMREESSFAIHLASNLLSYSAMLLNDSS